MSVARLSIALSALLVLAVPMQVRGQVSSEAAGAVGSDSADDGFQANRIVARFAIDPQALAEVSTSAELVAALREHLTLDVAMPLDEPLQVDLRGFAGDRSGRQPGYHFGWSALGVRYMGRQPLNGFHYASAVRESHGAGVSADGGSWDRFDSDDWDEESAWIALATALDIGLPQSSDAFDPPPEPGRLALRVVAVHHVELTDWDRLDSIGGPLIELEPSPRFASSSDADWEEPEGLEYDVGVLVIQLGPAPAGGSSDGTLLR